jgi:hypothetical protein
MTTFVRAVAVAAAVLVAFTQDAYALRQRGGQAIARAGGGQAIARAGGNRAQALALGGGSVALSQRFGLFGRLRSSSLAISGGLNGAAFAGRNAGFFAGRNAAFFGGFPTRSFGSGYFPTRRFFGGYFNGAYAPTYYSGVTYAPPTIVQYLAPPAPTIVQYLAPPALAAGVTESLGAQTQVEEVTTRTTTTVESFRTVR